MTKNLLKKNTHTHITDDRRAPALPVASRAGESKYTLNTLDQVKAVKYREYLERARAATAVTWGTRAMLFISCSFTSLGALCKDMVKIHRRCCRLLEASRDLAQRAAW